MSVTLKEVFIDYHLLDFIVLLILAFLWGWLNRVNPRRLFVPQRDSRCSYPHYNSGISEFSNLIIVTVLPLFVYFLLYILMKCNVYLEYLKPFDLLLVIIGHLGTLCMANIVANVLKIQVGRPRPDFFSVLGTNATSEAMCPKEVPKKDFNEEFKSFPSGHSASAMCGTLFFILFLNTVIKSNQFWEKTLVFSLLIYPVIIGSTRITQHRHHPDDVIMGLFIGFIFPVLYYIGLDDITRDAIFP